MTCEFCGGSYACRYSMGEYKIYQCDGCGTGKSYPIPDIATLNAFYRNFLGNLSVKAYPKYLDSCICLYQEAGLRPDQNLRMLDIGGGGGYFSKAFEDLGYGTSTYIDIDPESCRFAREELNLVNVIHAEGMDFLAKHTQTYDFIYCRHVIEHLPDPAAFLSQLKQLLHPDGLFLLQFPNGKSLEYLVYADLFLPRFTRICNSSNLSRTEVIRIMLTGGIMHGMDPPRHIWSITSEGITSLAARNNLTCDISYADIGSRKYSPGYYPKRQLLKKIQDYAGRFILSKIKGGTHLVAKIRWA